MPKTIFESATHEIIQWRPATTHAGPGVLIGPPDAGHGDAILNYGPGKSIVNEALENTSGGVYSINWKSATWLTRNTSIADKVEQVRGAMHLTGARHLIGLCQAGWLFSELATLFPYEVESIVIAGTPIDTSLGKSILTPAMEMPFWKYQLVVAANFGIMPGWLMLLCWKSGNKKMHYEDRYLDPQEDTDRFYAWYDKHQNLAGCWYLEIMKSLFLDNTFKDHLHINCPVRIATGTKDDITPPEQSWALEQYCTDTVVKRFECDAGHLGVFLARSSMPMWAKIFRDLGV